MHERLRVDPIACDLFGYCAELLPELIVLDEWGAPIISRDAIPASLSEHARQAIRDCPRQALHVEKIANPVARRANPGVR